MKQIKVGQLSVLLFVFFLGLYTVTGVKNLENYADSDDLILAGYRGELAHPPGYPVLVGILMGLSHVLPAKNYAQASNLLNALLTAICSVILFLVILNIGKFQPDSVWIAAMGSFLWGISSMTWLHASIAEVFPLATLFMLVGLLVANNSGLSAVFLVLAFFSHQLTAVVMLPAVLNKDFSSKIGHKKWLAGLAITSIVICLAYFGLAGSMESSGWQMQKSPTGWFKFVTRQSYSAGGSAIETYSGKFDLNRSWQSVIVLGKLLIWDWGLPMLGTAILGVMITVKTKKHRWLLVVLLVFILILAYIQFPKITEVSDTEYFWGSILRYRMFFGLSIVGAVFASIGIHQLFKWKRWVFGLFMIGVVLWSVYQWQNHNSSTDNATSFFSTFILTSLPDRAVLIADNDMVFSLITHQELLGVRPDLLIIPARVPINWNKISPELRDSLSAYEANQNQLLTRLVTLYLNQNRRVFLMSPESDWLSFMGVEGNPLFAAPYGYFMEISEKMPDLKTAYDYGISWQLANSLYKPEEWWLNGFKGFLGEIHCQQMYFYSRLGMEEVAKIHQDLAAKLLQLPKSKLILSQTQLLAKESFDRGGSFALYKPYTIAIYKQKAREALKENNKEAADYYFSRAWVLEPR